MRFIDENDFGFKIRRKIRFFVINKYKNKISINYNQIRDCNTPVYYPDNPSKTFIRLLGDLKHFYEIKEEGLVKKTITNIHRGHDELSLHSLHNCSAIFEGSIIDEDDEDIFYFKSLTIDHRFNFLLEIQDINKMVNTLSKEIRITCKRSSKIYASMSVKKGLDIVIPIILENCNENMNKSLWISMNEIEEFYSINFIYKRILTYIMDTKEAAKAYDNKLTMFSYFQKYNRYTYISSYYCP